MNIKKTLCLIAVLLLIPVSFAGEKSPESYYDYDTYLYGLMDADENVILEPAYDSIDEFYNGYAVISKDGLSGLVNEAGKVTLAPTYSFVSRVQEGLAIAYNDEDMAGAINISGTIIVPFEYEDMSLFVGDNALAIKGGKIGIINKSNKVIKDFVWDDIHMEDFTKGYKTFVFIDGDESGVVNFDGEILYGPVSDELYHIADDKVAFLADDGVSIGVKDFDGNVLVEAKYESVYTSGRGFIAETYDYYVYLDASGKEVSSRFYSITELNDTLSVYSTDDGYGLYDTAQLKELLPAIYSDITLITDSGSPEKEYLKIETTSDDWTYRTGIADLKGKILLEPNAYDLEFISPELVLYYDENYSYGIYSMKTSKDSGVIYESVDYSDEDDYLVVENLDGEYGIINRTGTVIVEPTVEYIYNKGPFFVLEKEDKYALLNKKTRRLSSYKYDSVYDFETVGKNEVAIVGINGKYGYIKADGSYLLDPKYDDVYQFAGDYAIIEQDGLQGFIDETGKIIVAPKYDSISNFFNGLAVYVENDKYGYLRENGTIAVPAKYEYATEFSDVGFAAVEVNGKMGLINKTGVFTVPAIYSDMSPIDENLVIVLDESNKYGVVRTTGEVVIKPLYDDIGYFGSEGVTYVKLNNKYALMNNKAEVLTLFEFDSIDSFYYGLADIMIGDREGVMNVRGEYILK